MVGHQIKPGCLRWPGKVLVPHPNQINQASGDTPHWLECAKRPPACQKTAALLPLIEQLLEMVARHPKLHHLISALRFGAVSQLIQSQPDEVQVRDFFVRIAEIKLVDHRAESVR